MKLKYITLLLLFGMYMSNILAGVLDDLSNKPTCNPAISSCTPGTTPVACKETACLITQAAKDKFEKDNKCKFTECSDEITEIPLSVLKQVFNGSPAILVAMAEELTYSLKLSATKTLVNTKRKLAHFLAQVKQEIGTGGNLTESFNYSVETLKGKKYYKTHIEEAELDGRTLKHPANQEVIANKIYGGRKDLGNGSVASGDGWKYRGRGIIQLTGKYNYSEFNKDQKVIWPDDVDFVQNPEKVLEDKYAVRSALWFWKKHNLEANAASGITLQESNAVTQKVNRYTDSYSKRFSNLEEIMDLDFFKECL